jgi:hypothetical protein
MQYLKLINNRRLTIIETYNCTDKNFLQIRFEEIHTSQSLKATCLTCS